ncbi:MAG: DUF1579 domain-containing protein [Planctomycetes bacterium]|nr:DUF1579 domain-containing protein [Planctomycetota bacterium]
MRISTTLTCLVLCGLVAAIAPTLRSQDGKPAPTAPPAASPEAANDPSAPIAQHAALARFEGDWTVKAKLFLEPGAPPQETKGKSEFKMLFGGRYLREKYESTFQGVEFEGLGLVGFDKARQTYVANWVDSMSTGFALSDGTLSADGNTFEFKGTSTDAATGAKVAFRWTKVWKDADNFVFSAFESRDGQPEVLTMEFAYKRKPEAKKSDTKKK